MFKDYIFADVYQRSKLVLAEIIALVQTDDIGRLNYVQLPKTIKSQAFNIKTYELTTYKYETRIG